MAITGYRNYHLELSRYESDLIISFPHDNACELSEQILRNTSLLSIGIASLYDVIVQAPEGGQHVSSLRIRSENNLPVVEILIITSGFPEPIVMDTIAAALSLDYPPSRYRIVVIDNSKSSTLQRQIEQFRKRPMNLSYHRISYEHYNKQQCHPSGYAIHFALQLRAPRTPSPFIAILDGDVSEDLTFSR